jgi:molybdenum cofactor biosynthesis enzyme MoaA
MLSQLKQIFFKSLHSTNQKSGPHLPAATINSYNASREKLSTDYICHAPFTNMYFNVHGDCAPCWLTFINPDSYPKKSIREIWFGEKYQSLRQHLLDFDLTHKCNVCLKNLQGGNYTSLLARAYDVNPIQEYPSMMELEIENTCNLECVMCIGELSSAIRKNREKLPPLKSPYNQQFVDELEEFIPHLKELRFNGGEPFLINWVFKIFEKVERLNPKLKIVIATNGTVWNYKVKEWLGKLNIHINFSLDSLTPDIYESIRVNAHYDRVLEHFHHFHEYCRDNKRTMCLMVNPMRNNWHEMPDFVRFVNKHNINIWFNTIHRPIEWSIWALPYDELSNVYETLAATSFSKEDRPGGLSAYNIGIYNNLVQVQIKNWSIEAKNRSAEPTETKETQTENSSHLAAKDYFRQKLSTYISQKYAAEQEERTRIFLEKLDGIDQLLQTRNGSVDFYAIVMEAPADIFYQETENRSVNSLVEDFENRFLQKINTN